RGVRLQADFVSFVELNGADRASAPEKTLLALKTETRANTRHKVPPGRCAIRTCVSAGDVPEVLLISTRQAAVHDRQLVRAAMVRRVVDDPGERRRSNAGAAENQPTHKPLTARAVVHRDARVRIGVEGEVRYAAFATDLGRNHILKRGPLLVLARASSTSAPARFGPHAVHEAQRGPTSGYDLGGHT